ncbi:unnamed protein product, partial [marine sediment metagenome]
RVIICRIGWMKYYKGPQIGDPKPVGGGEYNRKKIGHEAFNYKEINGYFYGFVQYRGYRVNLKRIDPKADKSYLDNTLVIFVAKHPSNYGQRVVGWYNEARILEKVKKNRIKQRMNFLYNIIAFTNKSVLLPTGLRIHVVPSGRNGLGQSNITYLLDSNYKQKKFHLVKIFY